MNVQLKKGALDLCVLTLLKEKDCYGYELVSRISEVIEISEGTIYPLLKRIRDDGYVNTYLAESQEGPPRKYYRLTDSGFKRQSELKKEWNDFIAGIKKFLEMEN